MQRGGFKQMLTIGDEGGRGVSSLRALSAPREVHKRVFWDIPKLSFHNAQDF